MGSGDAEARLRGLGQEVNARLGREAVVFTGPMADPRAAYASADIALGMGSSAARALAFGRPLIVLGEFGWSRRFGPETAEKLFRNSFWSDTCSANAVDDLVRDIDELAADPVRRAGLRRFGREFSEANFGLDAMTARLASVYRAAGADYRPRDWVRDLSLEWSAVSERWSNRAGRTPASHPSRGMPALNAMNTLKGTR